jgi:hypothetical protein
MTEPNGNLFVPTSQPNRNRISLRRVYCRLYTPITKLGLILGDLTPPMRRAIETEGLQRKFPL